VDLLRRHKGVLLAVADALIEKRFLTGEQVKKVVERFPLDPPTLS